MTQLRHVETIFSGPLAFLNSITDLDIVTALDGALVLYSASGEGGGIAAYSVTSQGGLNLLDTLSHRSGDYTAGASGLIEWIGSAGESQAVFMGANMAALQAYDQAGNGSFGSSDSLSLLGVSTGVLHQVEVAGNCYVFAADLENSDIAVFQQNADGALVRLNSAGASAPETFPITLIQESSIGGQAGFISLSISGNSIDTWQIANNGTLSHVSSIGAADGLGINRPSCLAFAEVSGVQYAVVGSAGSNSLTVLALGDDGQLVAHDHILDTRDSRFAGVSAVETIECNDRTYVVAGGSDDGLSLFMMTPDGYLQSLDYIEDTVLMGLNNVGAIALTVVYTAAGPVLHIYASGSGVSGITHLTVDLSQEGQTLFADPAGADITTSGRNDILVGGIGDDRLGGGGGEDILIDGAGSDELTGGAGRDVFILYADGIGDAILDFQVGVDSLDLSRWGRIYSTDQLEITTTSNGATIRYGDEVLEMVSANGTSITEAGINASLLQSSRQSFNPSDETSGTGGGDTGGGETGGGDTGDGEHTCDGVRAGEGIATASGGVGIERFGTAGDDLIEGQAGDDRLDGGAGGDHFIGGLGIDTVTYASATGRMMLDLQNDRFMFGDAVGDTFSDIEIFEGGGLNDQLRGDAADNVFYGGGISDRLYGRAGNDSLYGDAGADALYGNRGADMMTGGGDPTQWDRFIYFSYTDSPACPLERDIITDFVSGVDRIEISRLDADITLGRNQAFNFVGDAEFSGQAGELRFDIQGDNTIIQADSDGDGDADFEIELLGQMALIASDFLL